jgi:hypothetical protein
MWRPASGAPSAPESSCSAGSLEEDAFSVSTAANASAGPPCRASPVLWPKERSPGRCSPTDRYGPTAGSLRPEGTRVAETRETPRGISNLARAFTRVLFGGQSHMTTNWKKAWLGASSASGARLGIRPDRAAQAVGSSSVGPTAPAPDGPLGVAAADIPYGSVPAASTGVSERRVRAPSLPAPPTVNLMRDTTRRTLGSS